MSRDAQIRAANLTLIWAFLLACCSALTIFALDPKYYCVDVACEAQTSPPALLFTWPRTDLAQQYFVRRRTSLLLDFGSPIATLPGSATGYTDADVLRGVSYEYEFQMELNVAGYEGTPISAYSYLSAGIEVPIPHQRGGVLLLVDRTVADGIVEALSTLEQDLVGAGWRVVVRTVDRTANVLDVKALIRSEYAAASGDLRSLFLLGHVPVPYSGDIAPDFHETHRGAWPADVFYGEMSGDWTDETVAVRSFDSPLNDNLPGDGKFDQSNIPGPVLLEVGRVDFANMPSFSPRSEVDLLNNYLRKDHDFRFGAFAARRRSVMHDNFGDVDGDAPAVDAWRHFSGFFGHGKVLEVPPNNLLPVLNTENYLWAYGCGGGSFWKADGVADSNALAASDPKAVFWILHGSYFGDWNSTDNLLRAALATPHYSLASIWSGTPHWFMHHLPAGETLGYSTRLTQNNRGAYKSYRNFSTGQVHIALLGDPTLEMYPVLPPGPVSAAETGGGILLNWSPSPDESIVGYEIFRSADPSGPFEPLSSTEVKGTSFTAPAISGMQYYLVRAVKLERTGSGSYLHSSQGVIASYRGNRTGPPALTNSIHIEQGAKIRLQISGPEERSFEVLQSIDGMNWNRVGGGVTDNTGAASFEDMENGARFKLYTVFYP